MNDSINEKCCGHWDEFGECSNLCRKSAIYNNAVHFKQNIINNIKMELFEQLVSLVETATHEADKYYNKSNKAAGVRLRKAMQEIKVMAQDIRLDVAAKNKGE